MRGFADRLVRLIAKAATFGWFRAVEVTGLERIPRTGPVLLVANHHGGFVDPALLVATVPRPVRFLAMASLFRIVPLRPLLAFAGAIPVQRARDAAPDGAGARRNVDAFDASFAHLRGGGAIGIFPEGEASDEAHLLPIRTGAARIALGAHSRGAMGLRIVPVGLIYEDKQRARSRAYVRVGDPLELDSDLATNPAVPPDETDRAAVAALTRTIEARLTDAAVDFRSAEQRSALRLAANVALRWEHGDPRGRPPVGEVERLADRLSEAPAAEEEAVRSAAIAYREGLAAAGVPDAVVAPGAEEALGAPEPAGMAPDPRAGAVGGGGAPGERDPCDRGRRGRTAGHAAGDPRDGEVPDGDRPVPGELGPPQMGGLRHRLSSLAAHLGRRPGLRPGRPLVRREGDPGAAGAAGSPAAGRSVRPRGGPPRPPRPTRRYRPSCDGDRDRRRR